MTKLAIELPKRYIFKQDKDELIIHYQMVLTPRPRDAPVMRYEGILASSIELFYLVFVLVRRIYVCEREPGNGYVGKAEFN